MSSRRFLMIQLPRRESVSMNIMRPILDLGLDWFQTSPNSWVVWTSSTPEKWYKRIEPKFGDKTRIFICAIDSTNRHGRMPEAFWDFLGSKD